MTDEESLLACFRRCDERARRELLSRAQTLAQHPKEKALPPTEHSPRITQSETVIMAIRRLRQTYPVADRRKLFGVTSTLLSAHVLEGRAATEVIAELEQAFIRLTVAGDTKRGDPDA
jgi:hypothetical protein